MKTLYKLLLLALCIIGLVLSVYSSICTDTIECDENTLVISVCTGNMRALEIGVSSYAGYNKVPLILSDKTMPKQLEDWLPTYIRENRINKIIVVGPIKAEQIFNLMELGVTVKQINGQSISEILTNIADNNEDINKETVILTASDPLAGELGAYMKVPVFVTATNSSYQSSEYLDEKYLNYLKSHNIKKVIIVGNIPQTIKNQLDQLRIEQEELSGANSLEVSYSVNNKLRELGYLNNTSVAYYGFYGEIPTIIPSVIKNNAYLIEDSSNMGDIVPYLLKNNISLVYLTRNTESEYIQMEETDYISSNVINNLERNNISIRYLTKRRTLDEATGLYDMKILTAEDLSNKTNNAYEENNNENIKTQPPLIALLNEKEVADSNNITATIRKEDANTFTVEWSTIHPYTWKRIDDENYYATSNTGYEYEWKHFNDSWRVEYKYDNSSYYNITWLENDDYSWTEVHDTKNYTWTYDGKRWDCYDENDMLIYYLEKTDNSKNV